MELPFNISFVLLLILFLGSFQSLSAVTVDDCLEYIPGNVHLVVTVPHGGYLDVPNCPLRREGCLVKGKCHYDSSSTCNPSPSCDLAFLRDTYTQELAKEMVQHLTSLLGKKPHLIIMKCSRKTVDVNRPINEAAQNCPNAKKAFNNYHNQILRVLNSFNRQGLLLDIHRQAHKQNSTELGYGVEKSAFDFAVASSSHKFPKGSLSECTIHSLLSKLASGGQFSRWDVLAGSESLGKLLENEGFHALPGPKFPKRGVTDYRYFRGGYTVQTYGSHQANSVVDAIQMETPSDLDLSKESPMRSTFARALAKAATTFFNKHYQ